MRIEVIGVPAPQGSKRHVGRGILVESAGRKLTDWRLDVKAAALPHLAARIVEGSVAVELHFRLLAPKALPRQLWGSLVAKRPDVDKLARATLDGLTGVAYADDSQVAVLYASKRYALPGELPGATIAVTACGEAGNGRCQTGITPV